MDIWVGRVAATEWRFALILLSWLAMSTLGANATVASAAVRLPAGYSLVAANTDGSIASPSLLGALDGPPCAIAAQAPYLYWIGTNHSGREVYRAPLDGSAQPELLIQGTNACGLGVNSNYIFWTSADLRSLLGRANLDGMSANPSFLPFLTSNNLGATVREVTADSSHVYWTNDVGSVASANLDGTSPTEIVDGHRIDATGIAVDSSHLYWYDSKGGTIWRANLDGTSSTAILRGLNGSADPQPPITDIAVDSSHIYWLDRQDQAIGRANLDGSGVNPDFIQVPLALDLAGVEPTGLATDGTHIFFGVLSSGDPYGRRVEATAVDGTVSVKAPRSRKFVPLVGSRIVGVGSTIDTTGGRVRIVSARDRSGRTETGDFYGGEFKLLQPAHGKPTTEMDLIQSRPGAKKGRIALRGRRAPNGLWGNAHGNYVTKGHYGSATVRGTIWLTRETPAGTLFKSKRDSVLVRDFTRHRKVLLHSGQSYLAPAKR